MMRTEGYVVEIFGAAGYGKTRLANRALCELEPDHGALAFDPTGDVYSGVMRNGCQRAVQFSGRDVDADHLMRLVVGERLTSESWKPGKHPRIVVLTGSQYEYVFLRCAHRLRGATIYCDEAQKIFNQQRSHEQAINDVITLARNNNVELIINSQRPQGLSTDVRARADWVIAFRQNIRHNIDALSDVADKELWADTRSLDTFKALVHPPFTSSADEPLLKFDSVNDPLVFRMERDEYARYKSGYDRMQKGLPPTENDE